MQKIIISIALILIYSLSFGQSKPNVKVDAAGNFTYIVAVRDTTAAKNTGKTITDSKGNVYQIFVSAKGKYFINRTSKAGNVYKQYLNVE